MSTPTIYSNPATSSMDCRTILTMLAMISVLFFVVFGSIVYFDFVKQENLKKYGKDVTGTVTEMYMTTSRRNTNWHIHYAFDAPDCAADRLACRGQATVSQATYNMLAIRSKVPVVFNTKDISKSELDFDAKATHASEHDLRMHFLTGELLLVLVLLITPACVVGLVLAISGRKCKKDEEAY